MKRYLAFAGLTALALVAVLATITINANPSVTSADSEDDDRGEFTNRSIKGRWGLSVSGTFLPPAVPEPAPIVAVGLMEFDGTGRCSIAATANVGGTSFSLTTDECAYAVNPNGSGSVSAVFPGDPPTPLSLAIVIVDKKKEIRFIRTEEFAVSIGVTKRQ